MGISIIKATDKDIPFILELLYDLDRPKPTGKKETQVIRFEPKVCYSLNPEEFSDMCIGSDIDSTRLFQK